MIYTESKEGHPCTVSGYLLQYPTAHPYVSCFYCPAYVLQCGTSWGGGRDQDGRKSSWDGVVMAGEGGGTWRRVGGCGSGRQVGKVMLVRCQRELRDAPDIHGVFFKGWMNG